MKKLQSTVGFLSYRTLRLANTIGLYGSRRFREEFDVTLPEWRVMSVIAAYEPTTAQDVSKILATDKGWVSLSASSLKNRGFVSAETDQRDQRRTLLKLTVSGRAKYDDIMVVSLWRQERLLGCLPDGSRDLFLDCLDRLQKEADRMLEEIETRK